MITHLESNCCYLFELIRFCFCFFFMLLSVFASLLFSAEQKKKKTVF